MALICNTCGFTKDNGEKTNCPVCNGNDWEDYDIVILTRISDDPSFLQAMIELKQKDPIEYQLKIGRFKEQQKRMEKQGSSAIQVRCPRCGSTNIQVVRKWSTFGRYALDEVDRVCVNCKYKF